MNYFRYLRLRLFETGLMPTSKVARTAWYLLGLDLLLFALQKLLGLYKLSFGEVWRLVSFEFRRRRFICHPGLPVARAGTLWRGSGTMPDCRLRLFHREAHPVVLLTAMDSSPFICLPDGCKLCGGAGPNCACAVWKRRLRPLRMSLATRLERGEKPSAESLEGLRRRDPLWSHREICGWQDQKPLPVCGGRESYPVFSS